MQKMGLLLHRVTPKYYHLKMTGVEGQEVLIHRKLTKRGRLGIGTVHHIAWSVPDKEALKSWEETMIAHHPITAIQNRKYFYSTYFKDPGQIIYELATEGPGFTVDESLNTLGSTLMLPDEYEEERADIERNLPKLNL